MKKTFLLGLSCLIGGQMFLASQVHVAASTQRRTAQKSAAEKSAAELKAGRELVATQVKILTHFLYLFGGIAKEIQASELGPRSQPSPTMVELNRRNKAKLRASIRDIREGLEKFETDFRANATMTNYFPYVFGTADLAQAAENQVAAGQLDDAGKALLKADDRLTDALAAMR